MRIPNASLSHMLAAIIFLIHWDWPAMSTFDAADIPWIKTALGYKPRDYCLQFNTSRNTYHLFATACLHARVHNIRWTVLHFANLLWGPTDRDENDGYTIGGPGLNLDL